MTMRYTNPRLPLLLPLRVTVKVNGRAPFWPLTARKPLNRFPYNLK